MIKEDEVAAFAMRQFGGRIALTLLATAGIGFVLGALLF